MTFRTLSLADTATKKNDLRLGRNDRKIYVEKRKGDRNNERNATLTWSWIVVIVAKPGNVFTRSLARSMPLKKKKKEKKSRRWF